MHFFSIEYLPVAEREKATKVDWQVVRRHPMRKTWERIVEYPYDEIRHEHMPKPERQWDLMAPHWDRTKGPSDTPPNNPSSYMIHGDLWAACRDSHQALRLRMEKARRSMRRQQQATWLSEDAQRFVPTVELNGTFLESGQEQMSFTPYPQVDLVCFQIPPSQAYCYNPDVWTSHAGFTTPFLRPAHSALKFNPA